MSTDKEEQDYFNEVAVQRQQWLEHLASMQREEEYSYEPRDRSQLVDKHELSTEKE